MTTTLAPVDTRPQALYRFYDRSGLLLYLGITASLPTRLDTHNGEKPWWSEVADVKVEHFPDRPSVLAAEKAAIIAEKPAHNVQHNRQRRRESTPAGRRGGVVSGGTLHPGMPVWSFKSRYGSERGPRQLWLYWEAHCDPVSDDYYLDEIDADDLWREWLRRYPADKKAEAIYGPGARSIYWFVEGPGIFESAPLQDVERDLQFLTHYTWPHDVATGERLRWASLPVVDKVWRDTNLPAGPYALKGGFIQEATGWKPSPFQPFVNVRQLAQASGLYGGAG